MRASSLGLFTLFTALVPIALSGLAGMSCATGVTVEGTGGNGGDTSTSSTSASSSTTSATSSSSGSPGPCTAAKDCIAMNDACNVGTCVNGACVKSPANENGSCDDKQFCTTNDACKSGVCVGGTPKQCDAPDLCHIGVCDEASGKCSSMPGNDGGQCDDGDPCTLQGTCSAGTCMKGPPVDCSVFNGTCAVGTCDPQVGCVAKPQNDGTPCDDGLFCTVNDVCANGKCTGAPNVCAPPGNPCLVGACSEAQKTCTTAPAANGTPCASNSTCVTGSTCTNGVCGGGVPANQGGVCDDSKACTTNDKCSNGVCAGTAIVACANNDGCCPAGCSSVNDNDCTCNINLALTASGSMSSGGSPPSYGPEELNNQVGKNVCNWAWVNNNTAPSGAYFQYDWPAPVTIGSFYVETDNGLNPGPPCNSPAGRNLASGTVQWWNGASWVTSTTWSGQHGDLKIDLPAPVTTTKLRLYDVTTDPGNGNSLIYEWHVYQGSGCMPPP